VNETTEDVMSSAALLADAIGSTEELLIRFLEGFDETNATAQLPGLPNHAAWTLGHLALTMHRASEQIAEATFPLEWDPEPFAFGSSPSADRDDYPSLVEMVEPGPSPGAPAPSPPGTSRREWSFTPGRTAGSWWTCGEGWVWGR
jgi:hypothetical protein